MTRQAHHIARRVQVGIPSAKVPQTRARTALKAAAKKVRETAGRELRTVNPKATQANLDLHDGINVVILGQIIRAFERAHDLDPTIPRLVPISTRRLFNRKPAKKGPPGGGGTPDGAGGGEG